jgi:DNA mismatch repair protein MutL
VETALLKGYHGASVVPDTAGFDAAESNAALVRETPVQESMITGHQTGRDALLSDSVTRSSAEQAASRGIPAKIRAADLQYRSSIFGTFLIFEYNGEVLLVDQHAAHERVYYERFSTLYARENAVKTLLVPINFTPPAGTYGDLVDAIDAFREAGLEIEPFGDDSFNIVAIPAFIPENREEITVSQLLDELYEGKLAYTVQNIREVFVKLAACRSAVKEGDALSREEAEALMYDLFNTEVPQVCPHGRPTMVVYSREYFDRLFKRR